MGLRAPPARLPRRRPWPGRSPPPPRRRPPSTARGVGLPPGSGPQREAAGVTMTAPGRRTTTVSPPPHQTPTCGAAGSRRRRARRRDADPSAAGNSESERKRSAEKAGAIVSPFEETPSEVAMISKPSLNFFVPFLTASLLLAESQELRHQAIGILASSGLRPAGLRPSHRLFSGCPVSRNLLGCDRSWRGGGAGGERAHLFGLLLGPYFPLGSGS